MGTVLGTVGCVIQINISGMSFKEAQAIRSPTLLDRVDYADFLLVVKVIVEAADTVQMAVNCFGLKPSIQEKIDISQQFFMGHVLKGYIQLQDKMLKGIHIVLHCVRGVVPSLQETPVVQYRVGNAH